MLAYADQQAQNLTLKAIINDYIESSKKIQRVSNPSGDFESLDGLGEPKFHVDGAPFTENWGRPQRDGPALRSIAIMNFINTQVKHNTSATYEDFADIFEDVIKPDLEYVSQKWALDGFDLWEEVRGLHFFTSMAHRRALLLGAEFAQHMGDSEAAGVYAQQADRLESFITDKYYDNMRGHLVETHKLPFRTGLDSALFLGSIHSVDLLEWDGADNSTQYAPYSDEVVASLAHYIADMRYRYPININRLHLFESYGFNSTTVGIAVGRYPEDIYNGVGTSLGNPWFLCTATVSHTLYMLADYLQTRGPEFQLTVTPLTAPIYGSFIPDFDWSLSRPTLSRTTPEYSQLVRGLVTYADSFLDVIREHHDASGAMSEQFSRYDGYMKGAEKLTWSYGAFWGAVRQRNIVYSRMSQN